MVSKVTELAESEFKIWDKLVDNSPEATVFHQLAWLQTIEKYTNSKLMLLIGQENEEIYAAIPFFKQKIWSFLNRLSSPPNPNQVIIPYMGPIFPYSDQYKQRKREKRFIEFPRMLDDYIRQKIKVNYVHITTAIDLQDVRGFIWVGYSAIPRFTYRGEISDISSIWKGFSKDVRRGIDKAMKEGIEIKEDDINGYKYMINSSIQYFLKKGANIHVKEAYLLELFKLLPNNFKTFVCTYNGERIGGFTLLIHKDSLSEWLVISPRNLKGVYPNYLLHWKAFEWASNRGYKYFDLVGAEIRDISFFKSSYNFNLHTYYDLRKSSRKFKIASDMLKILRKL